MNYYLFLNRIKLKKYIYNKYEYENNINMKSLNDEYFRFSVVKFYLSELFAVQKEFNL